MSDTRNTILEALTVPGTGNTARALAAPAAGLTENVATIAKQLEQLRALTQQQADAVTENTQAVAQNTVAQASSGTGSTAGKIAKTAASSLLGGLSFMPLVSGIVSLFKGGKSADEVTDTTYTAPAAIQFEGAISQSSGQQILAADYGQDEMPRAQQATAPFYAPAITVQVQAMDSRSFLDHSDDIARAVREAILNSHSLADVVNES